MYTLRWYHPCPQIQNLRRFWYTAVNSVFHRRTEIDNLVEFPNRNQKQSSHQNVISLATVVSSCRVQNMPEMIPPIGNTSISSLSALHRRQCTNNKMLATDPRCWWPWHLESYATSESIGFYWEIHPSLSECLLFYPSQRNRHRYCKQGNKTGHCCVDS